MPDLMTFAKGVTNGRRADGRGVRARKHPRRLHARARRKRSNCSTAIPIPAIRWPAPRRWRRSTSIATRTCSGAPRREPPLGGGRHGLKGLPNVIDIRNIGLTAGIELAPPGRRRHARLRRDRDGFQRRTCSSA